jgi:hypothetical protein
MCEAIHAADFVLALYTEQGRKGVTLKGRGRDIDDIDLHFLLCSDTGDTGTQ